MLDDLKTLLLRDLATLRREVEQYPDDGSLWRPLPGLANTGGNLALHLAGNLQFFIGEQIGHSGYVRDRDGEFAARDLPRAQVLAAIDGAVQAVQVGLSTLEPARLEQPFPTQLAGQTVATRFFLLSLCAHLGYHLGQMNFHRRMATRG